MQLSIPQGQQLNSPHLLSLSSVMSSILLVSFASLLCIHFCAHSITIIAVNAIPILHTQHYKHHNNYNYASNSTRHLCSLFPVPRLAFYLCLFPCLLCILFLRPLNHKNCNKCNTNPTTTTLQTSQLQQQHLQIQQNSNYNNNHNNNNIGASCQFFLLSFGHSANAGFAIG